MWENCKELGIIQLRVIAQGNQKLEKEIWRNNSDILHGLFIS